MLRVSWLQTMSGSNELSLMSRLNILHGRMFSHFPSRDACVRTPTHGTMLERERAKKDQCRNNACMNGCMNGCVYVLCMYLCMLGRAKFVWGDGVDRLPGTEVLCPQCRAF